MLVLLRGQYKVQLPVRKTQQHRAFIPFFTYQSPHLSSITTFTAALPKKKPFHLYSLASQLACSIICEANYLEGARTARIGEANQASECKCAKNLSITETLTVKYVIFYRCELWDAKPKNKQRPNP